MYKKIVLGAAVTAAIVGAGGTALAVTGDGTTSGSPTPSTTSSGTHAKGHGKHGKGLRIEARRLEHAQIVTKGKDGAVTRDLIRGSVTSVSSSSIAVKAADGTTMTFTVDKNTKVRVRTSGKPADSTISHVATGDSVFVVGVGASNPVAKHVVDVKK